MRKYSQLKVDVPILQSTLDKNDIRVDMTPHQPGNLKSAGINTNTCKPSHEKRHFPSTKDSIQLQIDQMHCDLMNQLNSFKINQFERKPLLKSSMNSETSCSTPSHEITKKTVRLKNKKERKNHGSNSQ